MKTTRGKGRNAGLGIGMDTETHDRTDINHGEADTYFGRRHNQPISQTLPCDYHMYKL